MQEGSDVHHAVPVVAAAQERFPELRACGFDRGFHSPENRRDPAAMLDLNALPKKGYLSKAERERQSEPGFAEARRQHPAVESAISCLERRGLDRVRSHGRDGFARTAASAALAANCCRLGRLLGKNSGCGTESDCDDAPPDPPPFIEITAFSRVSEPGSGQPCSGGPQTRCQQLISAVRRASGARIRAGSAAGWRPGRAELPPDADENRGFLTDTR